MIIFLLRICGIIVFHQDPFGSGIGPFSLILMLCCHPYTMHIRKVQKILIFDICNVIQLANARTEHDSEVLNVHTVLLARFLPTVFC